MSTSHFMKAVKVSAERLQLNGINGFTNRNVATNSRNIRTYQTHSCRSRL